MGKYNSVTLDRDRAFDVNSLQELLTQGKSILNQAIDLSKKMEASISTIASTYSGIEGGYKVGALGADIDSLRGTLVKGIYQDTIDQMDRLLTKLMDDMPAYDNSLAQDVDGIGEILGSVRGRIEELRGLLEAGDVNLAYQEFRSRLEEVKTGWGKSTVELEEILAEIAKDMLGGKVAAVQYSEDPINLSTGNFVYDHKDIKIGGEIPLSFHRYYNSKTRNKGCLGRCFVHNYEVHLEENAEKGKITVAMGDGQRKTFRKGEDGTYRSLYSAVETLTEEGDNYVLTTLAGERTVFWKEGQMTRQENQNGRGITFSYGEEGRLEKAETDSGAFLKYAYDEDGQLVLVEDHTGRKVELSYEKGKISAVKTPVGSVYAYRYGKNGRIEETVNPRGYVTVKNTYDEKRRITGQEFPDGGHMRYTYDDGKRQVILTERNGSKITYVHDSRYRNTDVLYEDGTKEHFGYNGKNQRVLYVDRNGNETRMAYDNRGNLTQIINALGEKTNFTYNADNQLMLLKVNGKEKLRNGYDKSGNLIFSTGADGSGNRMVYDRMGRPVCMENADKNITRITYDERGNIRNIRDAKGAEISYQYDFLNRVVKTTDGNGNNTLFEYDEADRIRKVTNPLGDSRSYCYNESGRITQMTDYDGFSVGLEYNCLNKPQTITDKEGNITRFYYDKMWNISELQQADGGKYHYKYDILGRLEEECFPEGGTVSYTYDKNGNRTGETDGEGNKTSFEYDALNRVIKITDAAGAETCYDYDQDGNIVCITDPFKNCTYYTYDDVGRRTGETDALGNKTIYTYTPAGKPEKIIYANGTTERYLYRDGLLEKVCRADGSSQQYQYDKNGNILSVISGTGEGIWYTYDALNRVVSQKTGDGKSTFEYDSTGNLRKYTDENGNVTKYEYSPNGNLKKVTDALGNETGYGYDCMGNLIKVEQTGIGPGTGGCQITSYERDLEGRVIKATDPAGYVERYSYDKNGRMIKKEDRDNFCTTFRHGNTGDLREIAYGDGRNVRFSYDALHRLEEVKDWNGTTKIMADALGRIQSVTGPDGNRVSYKWGPAGEKSALFYPDGKKAEYSYNSRGLLERLTTGKGTVKYKYGEDGRLIKKELPNGAITSYTYNSRGRIGQIRHEAEGFSESYRYDYDAAGNKIRAEKKRSGIDTDRRNFGYEYDALNRLVRVTENGKLLREYGYDAFGNRTLKKEYTDGQEKTVQYRYNEKNQLLSESGSGIEKIYRYDKRGNMTEVCVGEKKIKQFTFDATNRMRAAVGMDGSLIRRAEYRYNGLGQRIGQNIRRTETEGMNIRYTIDLTRAYYNMLCLETEDKKQDFYWDDNVVAMEEDGAESYYIQDDLGSPLRLLDELGGSREIYGYDEFGVNLCQEPEKTFCHSVQPFGYTGYQMEEAGGLYFAQARRYDAGLGRFISEDLMRGFIEMPYTLNHYGYCWNGPLDLVDLDGRIPTVPTWAKAVGTVVAVAAITAVATIAAPVAAAVVITTTVAGAVIGGVTGGMSNVASESGSFENGFVGGAINGAVSVGGSYIFSPFISNAAGGAAGSFITDILNNYDKPKEDQKNFLEMYHSASMAGGTQSLIGGGLATLWGSATGGWNIVNRTGTERAATALWDILFAGGFSFSTGSIASIVSGETHNTIMEFSDNNAVKE